MDTMKGKVVSEPEKKTANSGSEFVQAYVREVNGDGSSGPKWLVTAWESKRHAFETLKACNAGDDVMISGVIKSEEKNWFLALDVK